MIRDVFYYGDKPNVHPRERHATSLQHARELATTEHFWIINEFCNYTNFDWDWDYEDLADEDYWVNEHISVWPSQYQKDSGTWLCSKKKTDIIVYRTDVDPIYKVFDKQPNWVVPDQVDKDSFDFNWHPDPTDPPFIYQFGTQWQTTGGPKYIVPGATIIKFTDDIVATRLPDKTFWEVPDNVIEGSFDFSWHPSELDDKPYIHQFGTQWQYSGGPRYVVPGATHIKYVDSIRCKVFANNIERWEVPPLVDKTTFDFSWHPDEKDPPYIYQFEDQHNKLGGPRYIVPGATQLKYIESPKARTLPDMSKWQIPEDIVENSFDFSWSPDIRDLPFIYQFGTQWQKTDGPRYIVEGATQIKYVDTQKATRLPKKDNWVEILDIESFDYSWHPDANDPPYIYVFGNKYNGAEFEPTIEYHVPGATERKYVYDTVAITKKLDGWEANDDIIAFDYSWRPDPKEPPLIYQFGTQWAKTHGPVYRAPGGTEVKFIDEPRAIIKENIKNWFIPENSVNDKFDFSWHPDATAPPYIYQFGTLLDQNDGPRYMTPGNTGEMVYIERTTIDAADFPKYVITTTLENLINEHLSEIFWALNPDIDYTDFDFNWRPSIEQANYVHAFGSEDNINTQTYLVNSKTYSLGYREINYVRDKVVNVKTKIDLFYVDRGNANSDNRFNELKNRFPNIQKTRFLNSWVETISRCVTKSSSNLFWVLDSQLDYSNFQFDYYPSPWQMKMVHVFGTQWSHWGSTYLINKKTFLDDTKYIKIIEHLSNINFVKRKIAIATNCLYDIYVIDHGNKDLDSVVGTITKKSSGRQVSVIPYNGSYLNTFNEILSKEKLRKDHYVWVCSSICDYSKFDLTYISDPFARDQLHVFPSDKQKFGDTFLVDVNKLSALMSNLKKLDDYEKVNFNQHQRVSRLPAPVITTEQDTHYQSINADFDFPYAIFKTSDNLHLPNSPEEPMSMWSEDTKNIIVYSEGATGISVPKEAKSYIKKELYDYPYIIKSDTLLKSRPLDIVFLSNGEAGADENYEHLLNVTKGLPNRVIRVDGVQGRVQAYHAAARASNTAWMFTVFAKLKVNDKFDWSWQPDRLQIPKHYIFNATNPVNGLKYGHQAMIAYNKLITLNNAGKGLDFTMDDEHEVVDMNSGIARFNTDEWSTWRTSFREALKLVNATDDESKERLEIWLSVGNGNFAQYSLDGAKHAVEYYEEVNGDFDKLRLSYDWPWLKAYFDSKYK